MGPTPPQVLLVRHGETEWNARGWIQGHADVALSATGRLQAERLARRIAAEPRDRRPRRIVSSDLRRAVQTAEVIARAVGRDVVLDRDLREQHLGAWEGLPFQEAAARYPEDARCFIDRVPGHRPPGGESREEVRDRVVEALARHAPAVGEGPTLLVSHGGALQSLVYAVLGLPPLAPRRLAILNASLTVLERREDGWFLSRLNDTGPGDGPAEAAGPT